MCATSLLAIIVQYCQFDCVIYTTEEKPCCICQYSMGASRPLPTAWGHMCRTQGLLVAPQTG
ncbi:hypothetical protein PR003_g30474 [Phytophthora rubi]|uniref:Uncharacterized protein n=1 Tax=Phytophthora rubi TaxID=129364 RepID=A0A6A3H535_9STRA|nr:hypothetical protein PR002_g29315 [Phytophthora rubi]KAE8964144.1 hypothetical protein PR001_g29150 [Phytophthora rubi]KAE9271558.1 hypothetical protein PR003_g30474 [Phytophthora rubi]